MSTVWCFLETEKEGIKDADQEVLSEAKRIIGKKGTKLEILGLTESQKSIVEMKKFGPDKIMVLEGSLGKDLMKIDIIGPTIIRLLEKYRPSLVLASEDILYKDLFGYVSSKMGIPFLVDCVGLNRDNDKSFQFQRFWHGQKVSSRLRGLGDTVLATIRPGLFNVKKSLTKVEPELEFINLYNAKDDLVKRENKIKLLEYIKADPKTMDLADSEVIVSGGKGMGTLENFKRLYELADLLGASIGGTRVARDNGWIPLERQIGQTGKTVAPKLIICCGISGAMQHTFGMKDSKMIIAVNSDKNAPIFKIADVGIVGDVKKIIPELVNMVGKKKNIKSII